MTAPGVDTDTMSAECALAQRPDYADLHADCRQIRDVPLPHGGGLLLVRRCTCACHCRGTGSGHGASSLTSKDRQTGNT